MAMREIEALGKGLDAININGTSRTRLAVKKAQVRSRTRTARSWRAVGNSLRDQMSKNPPSKYRTPK